MRAASVAASGRPGSGEGAGGCGLGSSSARAGAQVASRAARTAARTAGGAAVRRVGFIEGLQGSGNARGRRYGSSGAAVEQLRCPRVNAERRRGTSPGSAGRHAPAGILRPVTSDPKGREFVEACLERSRNGPATLHRLVEGLTEEDCRRKPGAGKLSLIEHMAHMLDMERDVFGVRIRRVLEEEDPKLAPVDQEHYVDDARWAGRTFQALMAEWEELRRANVELVETTGPADWKRPVRHPDLGKATFADVVSRWS